MASSEMRALWLVLTFCSCAGRELSLDAPRFEELALQPTEGSPVAVSELLSRADATVFVFWSAGCPCVRRYQDRVDALAAAWAGRGVAFVNVSSNAGESLAQLREARQQRHLAQVLWRDEGGPLARALGARSTPTVVLVQRDGQVRYRGWVDNERLPGEAGREAWLEQALEGFASGAAAPAKSPTWGCTITRSLASSIPAQCHSPGGAL